jgi:RNase P/RNase MRP subunit p29
MNKKIGSASTWAVLPALVLFLGFAVDSSGQVQTTTSTTSGESTHEVTVERGEVVHVSGNDLVVKMEDGSLRDFHHVPESSKVTVDGQEMGIHDLKPGMKLQRTLTVTTTPQTITTVKKVTGRVFHVSPPTTVILTLEDGTNQSFTIPKGQSFNIDGQELDAFHLKKGMRVTATKVIEEPVTVTQHRQELAGSMPPPPPVPAADMPILIAVIPPMPKQASAPVAQAATAEQLPKTGSELPLIGLLGMLSLLCGVGAKITRSALRS